MNVSSSILRKATPLFLIALSLLAPITAQEVAPELKALERQIMSTVDAVEESVIAIELVDQSGQTVGSGSGVIVSPDGLVFTAAHVVEGKKTARAILSDGTKHELIVLGMNLYKDAAVCRMADQDRRWDYSPLGNSDTTKVTDWVIAMGHGRGYDEDRSAPVRFGRVRAHNPGRYLTTDCPLIGGDSGGPLFNLKGEVIAINSSINGLARFNVHAGVSGFKDDLARMEAGEVWGTLRPNVLFTPETPAIGIIFPGGNGSGPFRRGDPRPIVEAVVAGGPADKAGLVRGDLLVKIDEDEVKTQMDVMITLGRKQPNDTVEVILKRGAELFRADVTLIARQNVDAKQAVVAPNLRDTQDSPYLREDDKPLLQAQVVELFEWLEPLAESRGETYLQLYATNDITTPLLHATVIDDEIAIAPLSAFLNLPRNLLAWRPGLESYPVELVGGYEEHDLAVLNIAGLKARHKILSYAQEEQLGQFVAAVSNSDNENSIIKLGVVSVKERNLRALLGVGGNMEQFGKGALLGSVAPNNAASRMGLRAGDTILTFNGVPVDGFAALVNEIKKIRVGDEIVVVYERNGKRYSAETTIGARTNLSRRINSMDTMGNNKLSENTDTFQSVIQSDILVEPEECGAPIFSINGDFIGIAISDAGRNKSYIISAAVIQEALNTEPKPITRPELTASESQPALKPRSANRNYPNNPQLEEMRRRQQEQLQRLLENSRGGSPDDIFENFLEDFFGR